MTNQQAGYLKSLQILFSALLVGLLLATTVLYSTFEQPKVVQSDALSTDIIPLIMLSMIVVGYLFFNMRLKILANETDLNAKKTSYRNASLVKWAIFEGATMLALIGYFFLDIEVLLVGLVASLAHFAIHFPSRQRVLRELAIDDID
jgi:hypothetical protein